MNIYLRFALIGLFLIGGIILTIFYGFWYALPFYLVSLVLLVGYFLLGTIQSAAAFMQTMDLEGADKRLDLTFFPKLLYPTNRAMFYILKGTIAAQRKDMASSEKYLLLANEIDLPTDNEKAMVELQLANIAAGKQKWKQAEAHFRKVKNMKVTEPSLQAQIAEFDKVFSQRGQAMAAAKMGNRGQMMHRGGKRRRPKMR
ncbi:MAG: hypothetical protein AAF738_08425 [Bacteroidota bacterium]